MTNIVNKNCLFYSKIIYISFFYSKLVYFLIFKYISTYNFTPKLSTFLLQRQTDSIFAVDKKIIKNKIK